MLYRHHNLSTASFAALIFSVVLVLIIGIAGHFWPSKADTALTAEYLGEIATLAQIIGGIYAILLAVVTFSVQTHAQRDDEGAFLASYLPRQHGSYWVSAVAAAVTLVNAFVPIGHSLGIPQSVPALLITDVVLVPAVVFLSLWLLYVTTRDVSLRVDDVISDPLDVRFGAFRRDVAWAIATDQYRAEMVGRFEEVIEGMRLEYNMHTAYISMLEKKRERFNFNIPARRYVADIDLTALKNLTDFLSSLSATWIARVTLRPFYTSDKSSCLVIVGDPLAALPPATALSAQAPAPGVSTNTGARETLSKQQRRKIEVLLDQAFRPGKPEHTSKELNDFFRRFGDVLLTSATDGSAIKLKHSLESLTSFVRYWCQLGSDTDPGADPWWLIESSTRFVGPLAVELFEMVKKAVESGDFDKAEAVVSFLTRVAVLGIETPHPRLFFTAMRYLPVTYHHGIQNESIAAKIGESIDEHLHSCLWRFAARLSADSTEEDDAASEGLKVSQQPLLDQALLSCLRLLSTAMENGRVQDARNFFDRMYEHTRSVNPRAHIDSSPPDEKSPTVLDDYLLVVTIGWALNLVETAKDPKVAGAAKEVLTLAIGKLPKFRKNRLVWLWENVNNPTHEASPGRRLGIDQWDPRDRGRKMRSGVVYSRSGGNEWLAHGFYFALLKAESPYSNDIRQYFDKCPPVYLWDAELLAPVFTAIVELPQTEIPKDKQAEAIAKVIKLVSSRELAAKAAEIVETADASFDPEALKELQGGIIRVWASARAFTHEVLKMASSSPQHEPSAPGPRDVPYAIPRAALTRSMTVVGLHHLGRDAANWQSIAELHYAEVHAPRGRDATLSNLPEEIDFEIQRLRDSGFNPDLILVPQEDHFAAALFGKPLWEVEAAHRLGRFYIGEWKGLRVAHWPYIDPESILIADTSRFFGRLVKLKCHRKLR